MDNITHTLVGVTLAHALCPEKMPEKKRKAIYWASALASNLPDLDFVSRWLPVQGSGGAKLAYLLHHRGFTHTLTFLPLIAGLCTWLALKIARHPIDRRIWKQIFAVAALAGLLHIGADYCNDYGVHPFSPFSDRWFYGDTLFILEPLIWLALLPYAVLKARSRIGRGLWSLLGAGLMVTSWTSPLVPLSIVIAVHLWALIVVVLQWKFRTIWPAAGAFVLALWIFIVSGTVARGRVEFEIARQAPDEDAIDLILTPGPSNPFCRRLIALSLDGHGNYIGRIGVNSLWPSAFPPEKCVFRMGGRASAADPAEFEHLAPWDKPSLPSENGIQWLGEFKASHELLTELMRANCRFAALLNFMRAPFWKVADHGVVVGDLRYDRGRDASFATTELSGREECPWYLPAWEMPIFRHEEE